MPPRLTIHIGDLVTSTSRTGSQKPIGIPGTGTAIPGLGQKHSKFRAEGVSAIGLPAIFTPAIVIGNRHFQQTSVIGFTKRPTQSTADWAVLFKENTIINIMVFLVKIIITFLIERPL